MHEHDLDLAAPKLIGEDGTIVWANPRFEGGNRPVHSGGGERDTGQHDQLTDAPWLGEKLLIVRRDVVNAVGGLDEAYDDVHTAVVDFSLRARQRRFRCAYLGTIAFTCSMDETRQGNAGLERLRQKWAEYPDLVG
jgi:GT2 family glycosyltransferase